MIFRSKRLEHLTQAILSPEEQEYGLTLLAHSLLKYIPYERESDWLEVKPSRK